MANSKDMFFTPMHCTKSTRDAIEPKLNWTKIYIDPDPDFDLESNIRKANSGKVEEKRNDN